MIRDFEKILESEPQAFKDVASVKIADIQFSTKQNEFITDLTTRGGALVNGDFETAQEKETQIIGEYDFSSPHYRRPYRAYITFEEEEGAKRALLMKRRKNKWYEQALKFTAAPEPSDIIWENGHLTQAQ